MTKDKIGAKTSKPLKRVGVIKYNGNPQIKTQDWILFPVNVP